MSNYNTLKTTINANIKQNGNQEITGPILNSVLNQMVNILGTGYQFAGVAVLDTDPGTPDAKVFYITNGKGTYEKFGGLEVTEDEVVVLYWDTAWHKVATGIASQAKLSELDKKIDALALGAFYGYFPDSASLPTDVTTPGYSYVGLDNPYEIWNFNGKSWFDSGTSIDMNDADEEDITRNTDGKLQFKDRSYGDGMGYVILRKDKTFAEQVIKANTIYEIRYGFDLGGNSFTIPSRCILKFTGGKVSNGTLVFSDTGIVGNGQIFENVVPSGTIKGTVKTEFFSNIKTSAAVLSGFLNSGASEKIFTPNEEYTLGSAVTLTEVYGIIDFNGSKLTYTNIASVSPFLKFVNCKNLCLRNAIIIGTQDIQTSDIQYQHGLIIGSGCKDIEIDNFSISKCAGDCIYLEGEASAGASSPEMINIHDCFFGNCVRQQISIIGGKDIYIHDNVFKKENNENIMYTNAEIAAINLEPNESHQSIENVFIFNNVISSVIISAWELMFGVNITCRYGAVDNVDIHDNFISNVFGPFIIMGGSFLDNSAISVHDNVFKNHSQSNSPAAHDGVTPVATKAGFQLSSRCAFFNNKVENIDSGSSVFYVPSISTIRREVVDSIFKNIGNISLEVTNVRRCVFEHSTLSVNTSISKSIFQNCIFKSINFGGFNLSCNMVRFENCSFDDCSSPSSVLNPIESEFVNCNFNGGFRLAYITSACTFKGCLFDLTGVAGSNYIDRNALDGFTKHCTIEDCTFVITSSEYNTKLITDTIRSGSTHHAPLRMNGIKVRIKENVTLSSFSWDLFSFASDANIDSVELVNFSSYSQTSQAWFGLTKRLEVSERRMGTTAQRPTIPFAGFTYFDTDLGKMIVTNGTSWVNMDGSAL